MFSYMCTYKFLLSYIHLVLSTKFNRIHSTDCILCQPHDKTSSLCTKAIIEDSKYEYACRWHFGQQQKKLHSAVSYTEELRHDHILYAD